MPYSDYPNGGLVRQFLEDAGLPVAKLSAAWYDSAAAAAAAEFDRRTGRRMLAGASETRAFVPPGSAAGALVIDDAIDPVSAGYGVRGGVPAALALNTDYWLERDGLNPSSGPYVRLHLQRTGLYPGFGLPSVAVFITAPFGYGATLPDDVWQAVLERAAERGARQLGFAITGGGMASWERAERSVKYRGAAEISAMFSADWDGTVLRYTRMAV